MMLARRVCSIIAAGAVLATVVSPVLAGDGPKRGRDRLQAGKSNIGHLYLFEKDPETWEPIKGGAFGKMTYRLEWSSFRFVFNGHRLEPDLSYTLIYYPDPWPGNGLICLGEGVADEYGDVHIQNEVDTGSLPAEWDDNYGDGAKIWLVASDDVDCDMEYMIGWNPTEYLFEYQLMSFTQTEGDGGPSNVGHLNLFAKDPETWEIIEGGPWGRMRFDLSGPEFDFVFNGHLLEPDRSYTLLYYPDPWPGNGLICLGEGMVKEEGDIHIKGQVNTGSLPAPGDDNFGHGAKIWLVSTADVDCDMQYMVGWNPTEYLFEYDLISFTDTDE